MANPNAGAELTDRVAFCVVKANCSGPSLITSSNEKRDVWTCRKCSGYVTLNRGEQPEKDRRRPGT